MIIILEGIDNCGKNTLAHMLCERHNDIIKIDFPDYNSDFGIFIRKQLFANNLSPISLQLLFSSERLSKADYLRTISMNNLVVTTRYTYTGIAYGMSRGIDKELLNLLETQMPKPDIKIYISISAEESIRRSKNPDVFEKDFELLKKVESEYNNIITSERDWYVVNGMSDIQSVYQDVQGIIFDS